MPGSDVAFEVAGVGGGVDTVRAVIWPFPRMCPDVLLQIILLMRLMFAVGALVHVPVGGLRRLLFSQRPWCHVPGATSAARELR